MTKIVSIAGITIDWSRTTNTGDYHAWVDSPFTQPSLTTTMVSRETNWPIGVASSRDSYMLPPIHIQIMNTASIDSLRPALLAALDTSREFKAVVIADDDGSNLRYWMCSFQAIQERDLARGTGRAFVVTPVVVGDPYVRSFTAATAQWTPTVSGSTTITNAGDLEAFPTITITPTAAKDTDVWHYQRSFYVRWRSPYGGEHPIDVTGGGLDTAALMTAGKISNASNIGVYIEGKFYPFHILAADGAAGGFNSTTTRLWVTLTFQPASGIKLVSAIASDHADPTWNVVPAGILPSKGAIYFPSTGEIITYTQRGEGGTLFILGVARGQYGTTASNLAAGATGEYMQYIGQILYGPNGVVPEDEKTPGYYFASRRFPTLAGASTNAEWRYETFWNRDTPSDVGIWASSGWSTLPRAAQWSPYVGSWEYEGPRDNEAYTDTTFVDGTTYPFGSSTEWTAMGFKAKSAASYPKGPPAGAAPSPAPGRMLYAFYRRFAVPFSNLSFSGRRRLKGSPSISPNSPKLYGDLETGNKILLWDSASGTVSTTLNNPYSVTIGPLPETRHRLFWQVSGDSYIQVDIDTLVVTFETSSSPIVLLQSERTDYDLNLILGVTQTGEQLKVTFPDMQLNESITIDCEALTVTYSGDNQNHYSAVKRYRGWRSHFLRFVPGTNTFTATELGMGTLQIDISYETRWYS